MIKFIRVIIVFSTSVLLLSGCYSGIEVNENRTEDTEMNTITTKDFEDYTYMEGKFFDRAWDKSLIDEINSKSHSQNQIVADSDKAISIALGEFEKLQKNGIGKTYSLGGVFYDTEDKVWIVWFAEKNLSDSVIVVGHCYNIAVAQNSGQIIKVWAGE